MPVIWLVIAETLKHRVEVNDWSKRTLGKSMRQDRPRTTYGVTQSHHCAAVTLICQRTGIWPTLADYCTTTKPPDLRSNSWRLRNNDAQALQ